jgi:Ca2+-binding EF-hand superfamily protein
MASSQQRQQQQQASSASSAAVGFEDYLPVMAERLGEDGLMRELASGFRLLMDPSRGLITFDSLRRNAPLLGLGPMSDDDVRGMLAEGDFDGDGALSEMEFCVLMVRLSPDLMDEPRRWLDDAVAQASQFLFTS